MSLSYLPPLPIHHLQPPLGLNSFVCLAAAGLNASAARAQLSGRVPTDHPYPEDSCDLASLIRLEADGNGFLAGDQPGGEVSWPLPRISHVV